MITIYSIADPFTDIVFYVGKSKDFESRKYQHIHNSHSESLKAHIESIKLMGKEPIFAVLQRCYKNSCAIEAKWIAHYRKINKDLYNKNSNGIVTLRLSINDNVAGALEKIATIHKLSISELIKKWLIEEAMDQKIKIPKQYISA